MRIKNPLWMLLLTFVLLASLTFTGKSFFELYQFLSLNKRVLATGLEPRIERLSNGQYKLKVLYDYTVDGELHQREQLTRKLPYKNRWAAQDAFFEMNKGTHYVWYKETKPSKGCIDKSFPFKGIFSSVVLFGILIYFYLLGRYMFKVE